jgi:hypothetical protein
MGSFLELEDWQELKARQRDAEPAGEAATRDALPPRQSS